MGKPGLMGINIPAKYRDSELDTIAYSTAIIGLAKVDASVAITIAKLYASEAAMGITREAIQIHGGYGYVHEYDVERFFRDAKILETVEGTSEIQRLMIPKEIIKDKMA